MAEPYSKSYNDIAEMIFNPEGDGYYFQPLPDELGEHEGSIYLTPQGVKSYVDRFLATPEGSDYADLLENNRPIGYDVKTPTEFDIFKQDIYEKPWFGFRDPLWTLESFFVKDLALGMSDSPSEVPEVKRADFEKALKEGRDNGLTDLQIGQQLWPWLNEEKYITDQDKYLQSKEIGRDARAIIRSQLDSPLGTLMQESGLPRDIKDILSPDVLGAVFPKFLEEAVDVASEPLDAILNMISPPNEEMKTAQDEKWYQGAMHQFEPREEIMTRMEHYLNGGYIGSDGKWYQAPSYDDRGRRKAPKEISWLDYLDVNELEYRTEEAYEKRKHWGNRRKRPLLSDGMWEGIKQNLIYEWWNTASDKRMAQAAEERKELWNNPEFVELREYFQAHPWEWGMLSDPRRWGELNLKVTEVMANMVPSYTVALVAGGTTAAFTKSPAAGTIAAGVAGGTMDSEGTYWEAYEHAKSQGFNDQDARSFAHQHYQTYMAASMIWEGLPFARVFRKVKPSTAVRNSIIVNASDNAFKRTTSRLKNLAQKTNNVTGGRIREAFIQGGAEMITELGQYTSESFIQAGYKEKKLSEIWDIQEAISALVGGGLMGGATGGFKGGGNKPMIKSDETTPIKKILPKTKVETKDVEKGVPAISIDSYPKDFNSYLDMIANQDKTDTSLNYELIGLQKELGKGDSELDRIIRRHIKFEEAPVKKLFDIMMNKNLNPDGGLSFIENSNYDEATKNHYKTLLMVEHKAQLGVEFKKKVLTPDEQQKKMSLEDISIDNMINAASNKLPTLDDLISQKGEEAAIKKTKELLGGKTVKELRKEGKVKTEGQIKIPGKVKPKAATKAKPWVFELNTKLKEVQKQMKAAQKEADKFKIDPYISPTTGEIEGKKISPYKSPTIEEIEKGKIDPYRQLTEGEIEGGKISPYKSLTTGEIDKLKAGAEAQVKLDALKKQEQELKSQIDEAGLKEQEIAAESKDEGPKITPDIDAIAKKVGAPKPLTPEQLAKARKKAKTPEDKKAVRKAKMAQRKAKKSKDKTPEVRPEDSKKIEDKIYAIKNKKNADIYKIINEAKLSRDLVLEARRLAGWKPRKDGSYKIKDLTREKLEKYGAIISIISEPEPIEGAEGMEMEAITPQEAADIYDKSIETTKKEVPKIPDIPRIRDKRDTAEVQLSGMEKPKPLSQLTSAQLMRYVVEFMNDARTSDVKEGESGAFGTGLTSGKWKKWEINWITNVSHELRLTIAQNLSINEDGSGNHILNWRDSLNFNNSDMRKFIRAAWEITEETRNHFKAKYRLQELIDLSEKLAERPSPEEMLRLEAKGLSPGEIFEQRENTLKKVLKEIEALKKKIVDVKGVDFEGFYKDTKNPIAQTALIKLDSIMNEIIRGNLNKERRLSAEGRRNRGILDNQARQIMRDSATNIEDVSNEDVDNLLKIESPEKFQIDVWRKILDHHIKNEEYEEAAKVRDFLEDLLRERDIRIKDIQDIVNEAIAESEGVDTIGRPHALLISESGEMHPDDIIDMNIDIEQKELNSLEEEISKQEYFIEELKDNYSKWFDKLKYKSLTEGETSERNERVEIITDMISEMSRMKEELAYRRRILDKSQTIYDANIEQDVDSIIESFNKGDVNDLGSDTNGTGVSNKDLDKINKEAKKNARDIAKKNCIPKKKKGKGGDKK